MKKVVAATPVAPKAEKKIVIKARTNDQLLKVKTAKAVESLTNNEITRLLNIELRQAQGRSKGIHSVLNSLKKESPLFADLMKTHGIEASNIVGALSLNDCFSLIENGLAYNFKKLTTALNRFLVANPGERNDFFKKAEGIQKLLLESRNEDCDMNKLLFELLLCFSTDEREKIGKTGAKLLFVNNPKLFIERGLKSRFTKAIETDGIKSRAQCTEYLTGLTNFFSYEDLEKFAAKLTLKDSENIVTFMLRCDASKVNTKTQTTTEISIEATASSDKLSA